MKTIIIILVVLAMAFATYKWLTRKEKVGNGGQGGSEPISNDNPDNVKPC